MMTRRIDVAMLAIVLSALVGGGVAGIVIAANATGTEQAVPEPREFRYATAPDGRPMVFVIDCPSAIDALGIAARGLAEIAADSTGATCLHPLKALEILDTQVNFTGE